MESGTRNLSDRERTVLLLAADGLTDKEIAKHLQLSQRTIGTYWERMRDKLGHFSRTQLVAKFVRGTIEADQSTNYRSLFASWEEGVWIILPTGKTLYANHRIAELFELTEEEFEKRNSRDLLEKAADTSVEDLFHPKSKANRTVEFKVTRVDGTVLWISMVATSVSNGRSSPTAITLRLTDVTVQKRVKHTLDSCELSLTFLSDHCTDLVARFDGNLVCTTVNPSFRSAVETEMVGKNVKELSSVLMPNPKWIENLQRALANGTSESFRCQCPNCEEFLLTHLLPMPSESSQPQTIMSITRKSHLEGI